MFKEKLIELKKEIDRSTNILGECQHFAVIDTTTRQKISRAMEELSCIIIKTSLTLHSTITEFPFFKTPIEH